ncbi:MAG: TIGR01777 family oxidoreductase [Mycobacterium leprae]
MQIVIAGATGFIGRRLVQQLTDHGHSITVLSRNAAAATALEGNHVQVVEWGAGWGACLDGADAVVNLAGAPIADRRWTARRKHLLLQSRVETTRSIVAAMAQARRKPSVLINGSAVGYYGPTTSPVDETAAPGSDFLARICVAWEAEAHKAEAFGTRVVCLRTGVALGPRGGALGRMMLPFRLFAGGPLGSGQQAFPWVHLDDVVGLIDFALTNPRVEGPLNAVAPQSLTNRQFARALGRSMGRPSWLPAPAFALRLALGEMADAMLLSGQFVAPAAALQHGYTFQHPDVDEALTAIREA